MTKKKIDFKCEYLIIGSGAGGATASKLLTEKGKDVLLIEEGQNFKVNHIITPNDRVNSEVFGPKGMPYGSIYFEEQGDPDKILRERGYESVPFIAPRWDVVATDTYGNSPGMEALGDVKMLQKFSGSSCVFSQN